jgi:O-acetyl-ADP-ribose deacetylase (regulator of RNase III)
MTRKEQIRFLIDRLLDEMPQYREEAAWFPDDETAARRLLRSLMNMRPPMPLSGEFLAVQDELLRSEALEKGIVRPDMLKPAADPDIFIWQGDITRLAADAIVNAANSALLGCFIPCHGCIDNAIHSAAGLELRDACNRIMQTQGHEEPAGQAKITDAFNLPSKYVLHTVGPIVQGEVQEKDRRELKSCYESCLMLAAEHHLKSIAFCCISTGEFHFPNREAAEIAVETVRDFLRRGGSGMKVIFNVFKDADREIYEDLLKNGKSV